MTQYLPHSHADLISLSSPDNPYMDSMAKEKQEEARLVHRKAVGERISALREVRKLTQPQLASDAEITQPSLWAIENGDTKEITARTLIGLCRALGTTMEYIWDGSESSPDAAQQEAELVAIFRLLPERARSALLQSARTVRDALPPQPPQRLTLLKNDEGEPAQTDLSPKFRGRSSGKRQA